MSVTIKAGGFYVTRGGRKVGPMVANDSRKYGRDFAWYSNDTGLSASPAWAADGRFFPDVLGASPDDIVAEWVEPEALPVRQVTRHEIVPGTYGRVSVAMKPMTLGGPRPTVQIVSGGDPMTAAELRAAARVLVSLAEALEQD